MILRPFLHSDSVAISYLFGCGGHAACAVVDPVGDIAPYLQVADNTGVRIRFVIETHIHADHRSAGRALAAEAGAEYVLHAGSEVGFPKRSSSGVVMGVSLVSICGSSYNREGHVQAENISTCLQ